MTKNVSVTEIPVSPINGAQYLFNNLARAKVTEFNHGLHKYPAKFIPQIPRWALNFQRSKSTETVLDPFCGSGTTLVESGLLGNYSIGIDISPLAEIISRAKTALITELPDSPEKIINRIMKSASLKYHNIAEKLIPDQESLGLHYTWSFWFRSIEMAKLLSIRDSIKSNYESDYPDLASVLMVCLSSIAKSASYLNEDQIKVRFDKNKNPKDPYETFGEFAIKAIKTQQAYTELAVSKKAKFRIEQGSANHLDLRGNTIDRIITSPPYINAVDYTMAHKYNLFILGLIEPEKFKDHCRDYIGVTERAVRSKDIESLLLTGNKNVDKVINKIRALDTGLAKNRAFVVAQYFHGMKLAFREMHRVLRSEGKAILVVGDENRIAGVTVDTANLLEVLANEEGLETRLHFFHCLANRSSMRLNRSATGGKVSLEVVYAFSKK